MTRRCPIHWVWHTVAPPPGQVTGQLRWRPQAVRQVVILRESHMEKSRSCFIDVTATARGHGERVPRVVVSNPCGAPRDKQHAGRDFVGAEGAEIETGNGVFCEWSDWS